METTTLSLLTAFTNLCVRFVPDGIGGSSSAATYEALSPDANAFYIRSDNGEPNKIVNVYDALGKPVFSFERTSEYSTLWSLYQLPVRRQVALIRIGLVWQSVDFLDKPGLQHRQLTPDQGWVTGWLRRQFFLTDGASYHWTRRSQWLERTINPGGKHEERRERLARVRLLRPYRFEWELLVDSSLDPEIALATGFVAMQTQWDTTHRVTPGARTAIVPAKQACNDENTERVSLPTAKPIDEKSPPQTPLKPSGKQDLQEKSDATNKGEHNAQSPLSGIPPEALAYEEPTKPTEFFNPPPDFHP